MMMLTSIIGRAEPQRGAAVLAAGENTQDAEDDQDAQEGESEGENGHFLGAGDEGGHEENGDGGRWSGR
ncbi:MAG: hypothetical protein AB1716_17580 [Planctomycetota bacterium]